MHHFLSLREREGREFNVAKFKFVRGLDIHLRPMPCDNPLAAPEALRCAGHLACECDSYAQTNACSF